MTRSLAVPLSAATVLLILAACQPGQEQGAPSAGPSQADIAFIGSAATSGLEEVKFAQLATARAADPALREFAAKIVADATDANRQLAALAQHDGVDLPLTMDGRHEQQYQQLEALHGPSFDRAYVAGQLQDMTMRTEAFQSEADTGKDPQLRSFAQQYLPMTLDHIRTIPRQGG